MIKNSRYFDFFPYPDYRIDQEAAIIQIEANARNKKNVLFVAPNGTGKTIIALSSLLPVANDFGLKIVYLCRTHSQSAVVIKELRKINENISDVKHKVSGISIRGRNEMCLNPLLLKERASPKESMSLCKDLRNSGKCVYFKNTYSEKENLPYLAEELINNPSDAEDIIDFCREYRLCPYFLSKILLKDIRVIACNYQWVFNPNIQPRFLYLLGVRLNKCIIVIDECHNVIDVATKVNSNKLVLGLLTSCLPDIITYRMPEKFEHFVSILKNNLTRKKRELQVGELEINPSDFLKRLCKAVRVDGIKRFKEFIKELKQCNKAKRDEQIQDGIKKNYIKTLTKFWTKWYKKRNSEKYFFCYNLKKNKGKKYVSLEIIALDPREITLPIITKAFSCVNLSGTVNAEVYENLIGLNYKDKDNQKSSELLTTKSPFDKKNVLAFITEGVNTKNENRNSTTYIKMNDKIEEVISNTPGNVGIFCASYQVLNSLIMFGINDIVRKSGKKLFIENQQKSASENALMLNDFKSKGKKEGAVLLGVCGGRNSEGEDYPGDYMNAVVIAGFPYHLPTAKTEAIIKYYDKVFDNKGWIFGYLAPAMQRANQAAGRPIRKETDKGAIIFLDSRFKSKKHWISDSIRDQLEVIPDKRHIIKNKLTRFWNN